MTFKLIATITVLFLLSCNAHESSNIKTAGRQMIVDEEPGQSPYLTKAPNGNPILSWVRTSNDSSVAFCFAFGNNEGIFGDPIVVPNSTDIQPHGENLPKIIAKPTGEIIALWGIANPNPKNKYSGLIYY